MSQLLRAEQLLTQSGYIPVREIIQPMGTITGLYLYCPAILIGSTYQKVIRTLSKMSDLKIWKNPNTEKIYIEHDA